MSKVIIHDNKYDDSISFLKELYGDEKPYGRDSSNDEINNILQENNEIWMLGHGSTNGLFSRPSENCFFDRFIINVTHVQFLKDKSIVGIWCYANSFAERHNLKGLFSGMIVSEIGEAIWALGITPSQETIDKCNKTWVKAISELLEKYPKKEIPSLMANYNRGEETSDEQIINDFNFKSWYYYGE